MGAFNANLTPLGDPNQRKSLDTSTLTNHGLTTPLSSSLLPSTTSTTQHNTHAHPQSKEWERKQRLREYRVASRREKRTRKADEKKQRKLNATILRRMTKNTDKYTRNAGRNRRREMDEERARIREGAVRQAERLAAEHDPSGKMFNVGEVRTTAEGKVVSVVREREREARKIQFLKQKEELAAAAATSNNVTDIKATTTNPTGLSLHNGINPARLHLMSAHPHHQLPLPAFSPSSTGLTTSTTNGLTASTTNGPTMNGPTTTNGTGTALSKTKQRKALHAQLRLSLPPPPLPIIPSHIPYPPEGEEDLLSLWSLPSPDLERRVLSLKKSKAAARKALRVKQQSGKAERRAARDEKRRVYREEKQTWKAIAEKAKEYKKRLVRIEGQEVKRLSVEVNRRDREAALRVCEGLGFTLGNVEGVEAVRPKVGGMRGVEVDWGVLTAAAAAAAATQSSTSGAQNGHLGAETGQTGQTNGKGKGKGTEKGGKKSKRVDLSLAAPDSLTQLIAPGATASSAAEYDAAATNADYLSLFPTGDSDSDASDAGGDAAGGGEGAVNYNHRLRRKLLRALETCAAQKEAVVRNATLAFLERHGIEAPEELCTPVKAQLIEARRVLFDGRLETDKQERGRKRVELVEYNRVAKVLRAQAKKRAEDAGRRKFEAVGGTGGVWGGVEVTGRGQGKREGKRKGEAE